MTRRTDGTLIGGRTFAPYGTRNGPTAPSPIVAAWIGRILDDDRPPVPAAWSLSPLIGGTLIDAEIIEEDPPQPECGVRWGQGAGRPCILPAGHDGGWHDDGHGCWPTGQVGGPTPTRVIVDEASGSGRVDVAFAALRARLRAETSEGIAPGDVPGQEGARP